MSIFVAILGLAFLILDPRGGPLLRRPRRRDEPAQVLPRLPAGAREDEAERDRVRHRRDPARRLREDPGDAPARRRATSTSTSAARSRRRRRSAGRSSDLRRHLDASDYAGARGGAGARSAPHFATRRSRRSLARSRPSAASTTSSDALAPDAYWRARRGSGSPSSSPGPAANLALRGRPLRRALHVAERQLPARVRAARHDRQRHRDGQRRARRLARRGGRPPGGRPDRRDRRQAGRRRRRSARRSRLGRRARSR